MGSRRTNNELEEEIVLFAGSGQLITLNSTQQIALAHRTLILKERTLFTYQNPLSQGQSQLQALSRAKDALPLEALAAHEYEYKLNPAHRPRLMLALKDKGVDGALKELRVGLEGNKHDIVAILNIDQRFLNGFVFSSTDQAINFYEAVNVAVATQIYQMAADARGLPFNWRVSNLLAETLNGKCVIDPDCFLEGKQEEMEIGMVYELLVGFSEEILHDFRGGMFEMSLKFRIVDETSRDYALGFAKCLGKRIERLGLGGCQLSSNMVGQLLTSSNLSLPRLQQLNLSSNCLNDDVLTTLAQLLQSTSQMHTLNLSHNLIQLDRQALLLSFLTAISSFRLKLNLSSNKIQSIKLILKLLIAAEGVIPLRELDLSDNHFSHEDLSQLSLSYLNRCKLNDQFDLKLRLSQMELEEIHAFEFLTEEYCTGKGRKQISIPMTISKHPLRIKGKEIGSTVEQIDRHEEIDELIKRYGIFIFKGDFYAMKILKDELRALGVEEEAIAAETKRCQPYRHQQQAMIVSKLERSLNLDSFPKDVVNDFNEALRFARRKGLVGDAMDLAAVIKGRMEELIEQWSQSGGLGQIHRQTFYSHPQHYTSLFQRSLYDDTIANLDYSHLAKLPEEQLIELWRSQNNSPQSDNFIVYHYLLLNERPTKYGHEMMEIFLTDPRLGSARVVRFELFSEIHFQETQRVERPTAIALPKANLAANYGIDSYRFGRQFIDSNASASGYPGFLSSGVSSDQQKVGLAFIEVCNNFLSFLYHTPTDISDQTLMYLNYICEYLASLHSADPDLQLLLTEELILHAVTYFDSEKHRPLAPGFMTAVAQHLSRRVNIEGELAFRLAAHLVRSEPDEGTVVLHAGQAKVDWRVQDLSLLKEMVMGRGKVGVEVGDLMHPQLTIWIDVDELGTVGELWQSVQTQAIRVGEMMTVQETSLDGYWLVGKRPDCSYLQLLASYEHIGKLIFADKMEKKLLLRRVLVPAQLHSLEYLRKASYAELIEVYAQARISFREGYMVWGSTSVDSINSLVILCIWIDALLLEQLELGSLRRQQDEDSASRYRSERERIINDCIAKLYEQYLPIGANLDEAGRLAIISQLKDKQSTGRNLQDTVREAILQLITTLGANTYTVVVPDSHQTHLFFANNLQFLFQDRTQQPPRTVRGEFKKLLWFQLVGGEEPTLRMDIVEGTTQEQTSILKLAISGEQLWLSQCLLLMTQICRNRLSFPPYLLFACEDAPSGLAAVPYRSLSRPDLLLPILELGKYFKFVLPRLTNKQEKESKTEPKKTANVKGSLETKEEKKMEPKQQSKQQPNRKSFPNSAPDSDLPALINLPKTTEIEQILNAVSQQEQEIIPTRKSFSKKQGKRRSSRNR